MAEMAALHLLLINPGWFFFKPSLKKRRRLDSLRYIKIFSRQSREDAPNRAIVAWWIATMALSEIALIVQVTVP